MEAARFQDVFLHGVHAVNVVSPLPVMEDIAGSSAAAGVQSPGSGGNNLLEALHQVRIALERGVRGLDVYGLDVVVAHLGVTLRMFAVERLGIIRALTHGCCTFPMRRRFTRQRYR